MKHGGAHFVNLKKKWVVGGTKKAKKPISRECKGRGGPLLRKRKTILLVGGTRSPPNPPKDQNGYRDGPGKKSKNHDETVGMWEGFSPRRNPDVRQTK